MSKAPPQFGDILKSISVFSHTAIVVRLPSSKKRFDREINANFIVKLIHLNTVWEIF